MCINKLLVHYKALGISDGFNAFAVKTSFCSKVSEPTLIQSDLSAAAQCDSNNQCNMKETHFKVANCSHGAPSWPKFVQTTDP